MNSAESEDNAPFQPVSMTMPATLPECHAVIETMALELAQLREQMAWLQERLKVDSRNSSKPPSSDGPGSGNRAQRRASQRKRGAQKGHPGAYRALLPETEVDGVQDCVPPAQCNCGGAVNVQGKPVRHQVFDIPPVTPDVQEYRLYSGVCTQCGLGHRGVLPQGVPSGQIGPRALALVGVLGTRFHLTQGKIRDLLAQLLGLDFSVGAISQAHGKVAAALKAPVAVAVASLAQAPVLHMDETRYPREGSANWVWGVIQPKLAVFSILPSRARYVITDLIGQAPQGVVVSDRYAGYAHLDASRRQVCWAHLLRDFTRISQRSGRAGHIGRRLLGLGCVLFRWREQGRSAAQFEALQRRVRAALDRGAAQTGCRRTQATCQNLLKLWPALWGFVNHPQVPPTNNDAERSIRSIVLKRKISGPTRSRRGDEFIARGFSVHETCRRQGLDLWAFLHRAVTAWIDKATPPSMLPAPTG
ncbi:IS66 family transposase [Sphaerotilus microaerophilus]|uniref:Transposase n=1 Tax=Sphaerotilus microaerophilus TaxID=2914710 RepID=A0ABN6PVP0_9BURK|nr:IS66 family transposase [Sphaerotilus sp. FB-5]BDI07335.1 transposase [Sphaerotilus sp. FB-5]